MFPNTDASPIDITPFKNLEGIFDAVYNPLRTNFILDGLDRKIPAMGGLYMLTAQAVFAAGKFLDRQFPPDLIDKIYNNIKNETENIVLIGMPSCGKTYYY